MKCFYHGSIVSGIRRLEPFSLLHGSDKRVVYLTDNIPYSLFYIWDKEHNHYGGKHVTAWIKNGVAHYEEQFPEQLKTFYSGVSGYLYTVPYSSVISQMEGRERLFYSTEALETETEEYVPDVYNELIKYETRGELKVRRFNEQSEERKNELVDMIAHVIMKNGYIKTPDKEEAEFYGRYFAEAWERAEKNK